jgi:hypothetical protein
MEYPIFDIENLFKFFNGGLSGANKKSKNNKAKMTAQKAFL